MDELKVVAPSKAKLKSVTLEVGREFGTDVRVVAPKNAPDKLVKKFHAPTVVKYCDPVQLLWVLPYVVVQPAFVGPIPKSRIEFVSCSVIVATNGPALVYACVMLPIAAVVAPETRFPLPSPQAIQTFEVPLAFVPIVFSVESRGRNTVAPPAGILLNVRVITVFEQGPQVAAAAGGIPTAKEANKATAAITVTKVCRNFLLAASIEQIIW